MHELSGVDDNNASEIGFQKQSTKGKKNNFPSLFKAHFEKYFIVFINLDHKINNYNIGKYLYFFIDYKVIKHEFDFQTFFRFSINGLSIQLS